MKKAIYTIMIGPDPMHRYAKRAFAAYAARIGAELVIRTRPYYRRPKGVIFDMPKHATMQKWYAGEILKNFDRVLYLDADILVTPKAPDIFEVLDDPKLVYMFDEGRYEDRAGEIDTVTRLLPLDGVWPRRDDRYVYFNSGVILCSRGCPLFDLFRIDEIAKVHDALKFMDQTYINYLVNRHGIETGFLEPSYNRMELLGDNERRLDGHFVHYAGQGYSPRKKYRYRALVNDYQTLYGDAGSVAERLRLRGEIARHELWRFGNDTRRDLSRYLAGRR